MSEQALASPGSANYVAQVWDIQNLKDMRRSSQSAPEHSLSLEKPPIIKKTLTNPKLGPRKTVLVIAFRIALTLDVKIV